MSELGIRQGIIWTLIGRFSSLAVNLLAHIILARLLSPSDYGLFGIIMFFIVIANALSESGMGGALVRNKTATEIDYATIFLFNLFVSVILCSLLITFSGVIGTYYEIPIIENLLIVTSFVIILNALQFVQKARLVKNMRFKEKSLYEFIGVTIGSILGIIMALSNFGVWSLIIMQLTSAIITTILLWVFEEGIGRIQFSRHSFKDHYKFGLNTTLATMLSSIFDNIYQIILGKYFSINHTGLYYQAKKLQEIPLGIINGLTQTVIFSALSKLQDDKNQFKVQYLLIVRIFTVLTGCIALVLILFAHEIILLLVGSQWLDGTFFLQILSLIGFFYSQETINRILFKIYNDTAYILYLEMLKKFIQSFSIIAGLIANSLDILMLGFLISSIISYIINYYFISRKYFFLGYDVMIFVVKMTLIILVVLFTNYYFVGFEPNTINVIFRCFGLLFIFLPLSLMTGLLQPKRDFNRIFK